MNSDNFSDLTLLWGEQLFCISWITETFVTFFFCSVTFLHLNMQSLGLKFLGAVVGYQQNLPPCPPSHLSCSLLPQFWEIGLMAIINLTEMKAATGGVIPLPHLWWVRFLRGSACSLRCQSAFTPNSLYPAGGCRSAAQLRGPNRSLPPKGVILLLNPPLPSAQSVPPLH